MNENMTNLEKLVYYVNIFNSISNLDDFKKTHINDFSSIVRKIHFGYKKLRYENPECIEDAKKILMSIIDVHPNLENWINSLVNRNNDFKLHDLFKRNSY